MMARIEAEKKIHLLELSALYQTQYGGTRQEAHDAIQHTFDLVKQQLVAGHSVTIPHFGRFYGRTIPERRVHVPSKPSEFTVVPEHKLYHMAPSREFHKETPHEARGGWRWHNKTLADENNK